jgi:hypothetical protein
VATLTDSDAEQASDSSSNTCIGSSRGSTHGGFWRAGTPARQARRHALPAKETMAYVNE